MIEADSRDREILAARMATADKREGPRVGDFVRFADGTLRRISYHWRDDEGWDGGVQTSDGGSWHLGDYGASFSGALYSTVPTDSLEDTGELRPGSCWIFHHDYQGAGRGVTFTPQWRVYVCAQEAPR